MNELTIEVKSNEEIWDIIDKRVNTVFIHKFMPNAVAEWWKTDLKIKNGELLENLSVRLMEMDIQTDLDGLQKILELNTNQLRVYQFEKPVSDTLVLEGLPEAHRYRILKQNGLRHFFFINFEYLTVRSFDSEFLSRIEAHPIYNQRILAKK